MVRYLPQGTGVAGLIAAALALIAAAPSPRTQPSAGYPARPVAKVSTRPAAAPVARPTARPAAVPASRPPPNLMMAFVEPTISGNVLALPDHFAGKLVLVHFWASWCPYSRKELSFWKEAYGRYHDRGLEIVGVSTDKNRKRTLEQLQSFVAQNEIPWEQIYENGPKLSEMYQVKKLPTSFLVDGSTGKVLTSGPVLRGAGLANNIEVYMGRLKAAAATRPATQP